MESGKDHITRRHILLDDGTTLLQPKILPVRSQSSSKFVFQDNVANKEEAFNSVKAAIAYVFDSAVRDNKGK